jgi:hypothetical protein
MRKDSPEILHIQKDQKQGHAWSTLFAFLLYNIARWFLWVRNLHPNIKRRTQAGVFENMVLREIFGPRRGLLKTA